MLFDLIAPDLARGSEADLKRRLDEADRVLESIENETDDQRDKCADDGEAFATDWVADAYGELGIIFECAALHKGDHAEIGRFVESRLEYFLNVAADNVVTKRKE